MLLEYIVKVENTSGRRGSRRQKHYATEIHECLFHFARHMMMWVALWLSVLLLFCLRFYNIKWLLVVPFKELS